MCKLGTIINYWLVTNNWYRFLPVAEYGYLLGIVSLALAPATAND